jgi:hypothetical protein
MPDFALTPARLLVDMRRTDRPGDVLAPIVPYTRRNPQAQAGPSSPSDASACVSSRSSTVA